jgi:hypothetical protein
MLNTQGEPRDGGKDAVIANDIPPRPARLPPPLCTPAPDRPHLDGKGGCLHAPPPTLAIRLHLISTPTRSRTGSTCPTTSATSRRRRFFTKSSERASRHSSPTRASRERPLLASSNAKSVRTSSAAFSPKVFFACTAMLAVAIAF